MTSCLLGVSPARPLTYAVPRWYNHISMPEDTKVWVGRPSPTRLAKIKTLLSAQVQSPFLFKLRKFQLAGLFFSHFQLE